MPCAGASRAVTRNSHLVLPRYGRLRSSAHWGCEDFDVDPRLMRRGLLENGYTERAISGARAVAVESVPSIRKGPFDPVLLTQARAESLTLQTVDPVVARHQRADHERIGERPRLPRSFRNRSSAAFTTGMRSSHWFVE